jgi:hypothetical protein
MGALWLCLLGAAPALAMEVIRVEAGPSTEKGLYSLDADVLLDVRPMALRHVLLNLCEHRDQMENLSYCRVFKADGARSWSYAMVELPVLDPRDYVITSLVDRELKPDGTGTYRSCWDLSPGVGPAPRKGIVRLAVNQGCWTMTSAAKGQKTLVHYAVKLAPGGAIPGWAAGYVARRTLPDYMRLLERLSREADAKGIPPPDPLNPWKGVFIAPLEANLPAPKPPMPLPPFPGN